MVGVFLQQRCGFTSTRKSKLWFLTICWVLLYCMYIKFMQRPIKWLMGFDCRGNELWQMRRCPNGWTTSATEPECLMKGDVALRLGSRSASSAAVLCLQRGRTVYLTGVKPVQLKLLAEIDVGLVTLTHSQISCRIKPTTNKYKYCISSSSTVDH